MRADAPREIDTIASSIADGLAVDWERSDVGAAERERRLISHLRVVDAVAHVYRSLSPFEDRDRDEERGASAEPAGPRWGRLILLDRIGRGASADVFRAWDVDLEREVALKLLVDDGMTADAAANARMLREARRLARIRHPNVVHIYGAERHEGRIGLWMEFVRGRTLADIVRADGVLTGANAAAACADVCGAVGAVHAAGLLHRDIKAQNVIREKDGRIVLMDFGAGAEIGSRPSVAGTPIYLAPEVLAGGPATIASDLYSIGVLLFFLVSGRYPVEGTSLDSLIAGHRARTRTARTGALGTVPPALGSVVGRVLEPDPAKRFGSAAELEAELRGIINPVAAHRGRSSWRTRAAILSTAAVVSLLVATVANRRANVSSPPVPAATFIAVLPLVPASSSTEASVIADGLTDELIARLGEVQSLRVTAHTSVRRFRRADQPIDEIASRLQVGSVLKGSVSVDSPRNSTVHVNFRLIRAGADVDLWSEHFDRPLGDIAALEGEIARAVTRGVGAVLSASESTRLSRQPQHAGRAEQAYLEARAFLAQNRHGDEVRPVVEALQQAIVADPHFAAPHAELARAYVLLGFDEMMPQGEAYALAKREAQRALQLDPDLPDAHTALADVSFYYEWDWTGADASYRQAIALAPSDARARGQYARMLSAAGRTAEASSEARTAAAADPLSADATLTQGLMSYYERRYREAAATLQRALRMDPRYPGAWLTLSRVAEARGDFVEAGRLIDRALTITSIAPWRADRIRVRALWGDAVGARKGLQELQQELAARGLKLDAPHEAYIAIALGESDRGLDLLSNAVTSRDPSVLWLAVDPRVDRVRGDARFHAIVARLGRP
jgi:serine/threonine protein kinase/Tfp pilus assembly protein PilF